MNTAVEVEQRLNLVREGRYEDVPRHERQHIVGGYETRGFDWDPQIDFETLQPLLNEHELFVYVHDRRGGFLAALTEGFWVLWRTDTQSAPGTTYSLDYVQQFTRKFMARNGFYHVVADGGIYESPNGTKGISRERLSEILAGRAIL